MSAQNSEPSALISLSRELLAAHEKLLSQASMLKQMGEAAQFMARAQMHYGEAVMRVNAAMFGVWFGRALDEHPEQSPSEAARESEFTQP